MKDNPLSAILNIFNKLSFQQKIVIGGTVGITAVLLIVLLSFLNQPNYSPLYTNLSQDDASKVVEQLTTQKIQYEIEDNGKTIAVPKNEVYKVRLSLAAKGIPSSGVVGYDIFDKSTMGMSEFMQKLDFKRALEGELTKTIMEIDGVAGARVHLVIPQKSVFKDEQKPPTAAVVLKLRDNYSLTRSNIAAIINLVSSSVEGLTPGKVTLLDTRGKLLSKQEDDDPLAVASSKQYEIKKSIENYLAQKAQSMLDNVLGYGNSMVEVNADINFDQVEKTMESYDPNSQVAISEQTIKSNNNGKTMGDSSAQQSQNSTTNYDINKTIQKVVEGTGNIKRLSVAAVINDVPKEIKVGNDVKTDYKPRSPEEMGKLGEIIRNAVGVDSTRNDQFSLVNIPFETKDIEDVKMTKPGMFDDPNKWMNPILMIGAIAASIFLLKGIMKRLKNEKIIIGTFNNGFESNNFGVPELVGSKQSSQLGMNFKKNLLPMGDLEDEISDEAVRKKNQQEKISNYASKNPMEAAKLINAWLHEDEFI
ncbi:MAG: flagellar basal-body MS-ring/collar protein FliF [Ignavibacteriaceae bacterium]